MPTSAALPASFKPKVRSYVARRAHVQVSLARRRLVPRHLPCVVCVGCVCGPRLFGRAQERRRVLTQTPPSTKIERKQAKRRETGKTNCLHKYQSIKSDCRCQSITNTCNTCSFDRVARSQSIGHLNLSRQAILYNILKHYSHLSAKSSPLRSILPTSDASSAWLLDPVTWIFRPQRAALAHHSTYVSARHRSHGHTGSSRARCWCVTAPAPARWHVAARGSRPSAAAAVPASLPPACSNCCADLPALRG